MNRAFKTAREFIRFEQGRSSNPDGRQKGSKSLYTLIKESSTAKVKVLEDGQEREMPRRERLILGMYQRALKGNMRDIGDWIKLKKVADRAAAAQQQGGFLLVPEPMTLEAWMQRHRITRTSDLKLSGQGPGEPPGDHGPTSS